MSHQHLVVGRVNWTLGLSWCACGETFDLKDEKWKPPKHTEGLMRRMTWRGESEEVGE